jgi:hypothetical protein
MKQRLVFLFTLIAGVAALVLSLRTEPAIPGVGAFPQRPATVSVGVEAAHAEDLHECMAQGCSTDDCISAIQNGYTCKTWRCFGRCMAGKGFRGSCYDDMDRFEECTAAHNACTGRCR